MQAKTSAALIATSGKERIERLTPDIEAHATAIVGEKNFDMIIAGCLHLDVDSTPFAAGKCVCD